MAEARSPTSPNGRGRAASAASLDEVADARQTYAARGVCKAALGKSFLFGRRWTMGAYAVDVERSHVVRFEHEWDTPANRYAFAGDCLITNAGDTWDAVLELSRVADLLSKDAKLTTLALKFPTSTRRDAFRRAIEDARSRAPPDAAAEALQFARAQVRDDHFAPPGSQTQKRRLPSPAPAKKAPASPRSKLKELRATLDDDLGPTVAVLAAGLADDPDEAWKAQARASVAQLNGRLDRLQFVGVDGVVTADIEDEAERSACRDARKALNRDVERVRGRVQGLFEELKAALS